MWRDDRAHSHPSPHGFLRRMPLSYKSLRVLTSRNELSVITKFSRAHWVDPESTYTRNSVARILFIISDQIYEITFLRPCETGPRAASDIKIVSNNQTQESNAPSERLCDGATVHSIRRLLVVHCHLHSLGITTPQNPAVPECTSMAYMIDSAAEIDEATSTPSDLSFLGQASLRCKG